MPFQSYFSGNVIQICPVGALTSTAYRFRSRPFDLVSSPSICEHCAGGCALRTDSRRNVIMRRLAGNDPAVNEEWNCDKGRFAFGYVTADDRLTTPLVRGSDGVLAPVSWTTAMSAAAAGLTGARDARGVGVLTGGRLTTTDAYAYAKFARLALRTNDIDFRARAHSAEEMAFLADRVVRSTPDSGGVTFTSVEHAPQVLLVALEPEDESAILFLRLRKASRRGASIAAVAPLASRGLEKMGGTLLPAAPGTEIAVLRDLHTGDGAVATGLRATGAVILVGERAAEVPGLLTAAAELADETGAALAWVPRRAGERGALLSGAAPTLLPGGRPVSDAAARTEVERAWGATVPAEPGRDTAGILAAAGAGALSGLLIGGVEIADLPDPAAARAAIERADFVVSLEIRRSEVTELADVVFPVAAAPEKSGSYLNWEGRVRRFDNALRLVGGLDDGRVLDTLGVEMDVDLLTQTPQSAHTDLGRIGPWSPQRSLNAGESASSVGRDAGLDPHDRRGRVRPRSAVDRLRGFPARLTPCAAGWQPRRGQRAEPGRHPPRRGCPAVGARCERVGPVRRRHRDGDRPRRLARPAAGPGRDARRCRLGPRSGRRTAQRTRTGCRGRRPGDGPGGRQPMSVLASIAGLVADSPTPEPDGSVAPLIAADPWWLMLIKAVVIFASLLLLTLFAIWFERRVVGRMQHRPGPNWNGPFGLLQSLADALKLIFKEGLIPSRVDKFVYIAAPIMCAIPAFLIFSIIPVGGEVSMFGHETALQLADLPVGVLAALAFSSIGIYGIVLGGWASGSTYPLLGRAAGRRRR